MEEISPFEQENLFTNTDRYIPENQQQNREISPKIPLPELNICPASDNSPAISSPEQDIKKTNERKTEKQIRKIVFFYADKTFEEYYPE